MGTELWCRLNLQNCGLSEMNVENKKRRCYALYNQTPKAVAQGTVPCLRGIPESFPSSGVLMATSAVYLDSPGSAITNKTYVIPNLHRKRQEWGL